MPLEILTLDPTPLRELRFLNAARRGGTEVARVGIHAGTVRGLPEGIDALLATSDLQGIVPAAHTGEARLLGCAVAEAVEEMGFEGALPRAARTGVVLAGDFYSAPSADKRGGFGDVAPVWAAFAERFAWVVGVAGNHDDVSRVTTSPVVSLLETERLENHGLCIAGVGLIAGNPERPGRRAEDEQLARVDLVAELGLDLLLLHEGPSGDDRQPGSAAIRAAVERHHVPLTICGHTHWHTPRARHAWGQILNVDARVVVLRARRW